MPHTIAIEERVVVGRYWGKVTIDEVRSVKENIPHLEGFDPELPHIADFSQADIKDISFSSIETFMRESSVASPLALQVVVVPDEPSMETAKRVQQMGPATGRSILVARSMAEARATLAALSSRARQKR
jgi:hypothetical protein